MDRVVLSADGVGVDQEVAAMSQSGQRQLVYFALFILCAALALVAGPVAGGWSFLQVAVAFELACRFATHRRDVRGQSGSDH